MTSAELGIADRVRDLDTTLFDSVLAQQTAWDRRALLALHAATADTRPSFAYLEIGSYLGGSLQAVVRDPRCTQIISIDPRVTTAPNTGVRPVTYVENTTAHMRELLGTVPGADLSKLETFEVGADTLDTNALPVRPAYCFIDGEHTDAAALQDARFCAEAVAGRGVVAFHDAPVVQNGIKAFLREAWDDVSRALAFGGSVFAVELGGEDILRSPVVNRAIGSTWHLVVWRFANRSWPTPMPLVAGWSAMQWFDRAILSTRRNVERLKSSMA
jgi:methyltransferase family protein